MTERNRIERQGEFLKALKECDGDLTAARALCGDYPPGLVLGWAGESPVFSDLLRLLQGIPAFGWPPVQQRVVVLCQRAEDSGDDAAGVFRQALSGQDGVAVAEILEDSIR